MQHIQVKIAFALLGFLMLFGAVRVYSPTAHASGSPSITITSLYAADANDKQKSQFNQDDLIHYIVWVNNTTNNTLSAHFHVEAYYTLKDNSHSQTIVDDMFDNVSVPPGQQGYRDIKTVPDNTYTGTFKYHVWVYNEANYPNDYDFKETTFSVTGVLDVPYASQWQQQASAAEDCGPASVAMALNFFGKGPGIDGNAIHEIHAITGEPDNQGTNAKDLEYAISHYGGTSSPIDANEVSSASAAISLMKQITLLDNPVIVFLDGTALGRPYPLPGHWLVVLGFSHDSSNVVYVNDPDSQYLKGEAQTLKESDLITAMSTDWVKAQGQPYGIIVG
jgi:hypothetical protein